MIAGPAATAAAVLLPPALGAVALRFVGLRARGDRLAYAAWSVLVGSLLTGVAVFGALWFGASLASLPWIPTGLLAVLLCALVVARAASRRAAAPETPSSVAAGPGRGLSPPARRDGPLERAVFGLAVALSLAVTADRVVAANGRLVTLGDEGNIWSGKAKAVFVSGGFRDAALAPRLVDILDEPTAYLNHADYPPLNPMLQLWVFAWHGELTHWQNRLPIQLQVVALVLLLASAVRRAVRGAAAAAALLLFVGADLAGEACRYAVADAMVALGLLASIDGWRRLARGERGGTAACTAAALAYLMGSKNEGIMMVLVIAVAGVVTLLLVRRAPGVGSGPVGPASVGPGPARSVGGAGKGGGTALGGGALPALLFVPALGVLALQVVFNERFDLRNDLAQPGDGPPFWARIAGQAAEYAPMLFDHAFDALVRRASATNLLVVLALGLAVVFPVRALRAAALPVLVLFGVLAADALVYLGTTREMPWHLETSLDRLVLQVLPLAALTLALVAAAVFPGLRPASRR